MNAVLESVAEKRAVQPATRPYYPELDGVRALATLMIMCFHFGPGLLPKWLLSFAQTGVDLFFVLSGFLITGILLRCPVRRWDELRRFCFRRALRIFPLYYFFLACWVLLMKKPLSGWYWVYLQNVRYLGWLPTGPPHFWSLAVEEQFYLVWPFLVIFWPRRWLAHTMWVVVALSFVLQVLLTGSEVACFFFTPTRVEALAAGGIIAFYFAKGTLHRARPFLVVLGVISLLLQPVEKLLSHGTGLAGVEMIRSSTSTGLYVCIVALLIDGRKTLVHGWLSARPLRAVARVSYGLYVYHPLVFEWLRVPLSFLPIIEVEIICFASAYLVAWLSYFGFEKRIMGLKDRPARARQLEAVGSSGLRDDQHAGGRQAAL